jgi:hypothetical protein
VEVRQDEEHIHPANAITTATMPKRGTDFNPHDDFRGVLPEERYTIPVIPDESAEVVADHEGANIIPELQLPPIQETQEGT